MKKNKNLFFSLAGFLLAIIFALPILGFFPTDWDLIFVFNFVPFFLTLAIGFFASWLCGKIIKRAKISTVWIVFVVAIIGMLATDFFMYRELIGSAEKVLLAPPLGYLYLKLTLPSQALIVIVTLAIIMVKYIKENKERK